MADQQGHELAWDGAIEHDSEFTLLPDGEYDFEVLRFERARHTPGEGGKLPPCNKAVLQIRLSAPDGKHGQVRHNLFLHSSFEGRLCEFFSAIGHRKHGERLIMNFGAVPGARGRCKVGTRTWIGNNGKEMKNNEITRFLYPDSPENGAGAPSFQAGRF